MIPRSSSHLGGRGVCSTPAAGLTQGLGRQSAAESTCQVGGSPAGASRDCVFCSRYPTAKKLPSRPLDDE